MLGILWEKKEKIVTFGYRNIDFASVEIYSCTFENFRGESNSEGGRYWLGVIMSLASSVASSGKYWKFSDSSMVLEYMYYNAFKKVW